MKIFAILTLSLTPFIGWGQTCVLASSQELVYRSSGQSLDSALYWGEDVTLCFTVSTYTPVGNGCQWFQGVVPQFGDGWDLTEFDGSIDATLNDSDYPSSGVYGGTWGWYDDVHYNSDNESIYLGPYGHEGSLGLCYLLYQDCALGDPIVGGTISGSCNNGGDILPPGWFVSFPVDGCPQSGHPDDDWGDGSGCGSTMGPWEFCMDLKTKDSCDESDDLTVTFFTFTDGETGAWTGGPSVCSSDSIDSKTYEFECSPLELCPEPQASVSDGDCSDPNGDITLDITPLDPSSLTYDWDWLETPGNDDFDGMGPTDDPQNLINILPGEYHVTVTDGNGCTGTTMAVVADVEFDISVVGSELFCFGDSIGTVGVSNIINEIPGGTLTYDWDLLEESGNEDFDGNGPINDPANLANLSAGSFAITVTTQIIDSLVCTALDTAFVLQPLGFDSIYVDTTICVGDSIMLFGEWYDTEGSYTEEIIDTTSGCTVILILEITEDENPVGAFVGSYCANDSILVYGQWYDSVGIYITTVSTESTGCDTIMTLFISEDPLSTSTVVLSHCAGDSVIYNNEWYQGAGVYTDTIESATSECDTVVTIFVIEDPLEVGMVSANFCTGDSVLVYGEWYSSVGSYIDTVTALTGCDTIMTINIQEIELEMAQIDTVICDGDSILIEEIWYDSAGIYTQTLPSVGSCDTILTIAIESQECAPEEFQVKIQNADLYIQNVTKGIILTSPDGQCWRLTVETDGTLSVVLVECPE